MELAVKQEIEGFAGQILHSYFCEARVDFLISTFAPDIVWLGAGEKQKAQGREQVAACFLAGVKDLAPCDMYDERYVTRAFGENCYLCEEDSWISPKPGTGLYFKAHQRVTFLFERLPDGRLQTAHIHNSVSYSDLGAEELFPARAGREAYERLKRTLRQQDRQIELMLSQLPGGMQICRNDKDFTTKWVSDSLCRMLGFAGPEEYGAATGNCCRGFICEEDYQPAYERVREMLAREGSYTVEYRIRRRDGSCFWASDLGKRVTDMDGEEVVYCFIADITERKERELQLAKSSREIRRQAQFLTRLYNTVPCGILQFTTDPAHEVVSINRMVWEFYGFSSEQEYRERVKSPFQLVSERDKEWVRPLVEGLALDGEPVSYTRESRRQDGSAVWISVIMARLTNADGLEVIQAVFTDITEMKALQTAQEQERLLENRALRAAICTAYPLIMSVNLTRDSYSCFITEQPPLDMPRQGAYDGIIRRGARLASPAYREDFEAGFSRESVLARFAGGGREVYMELRLSESERCHWIAAHLIYVENPFNPDVMAILLVKVLDSQRAEKARQEQLLRDALSAAKAASRAKSDFLSRMSHDIRTPMNAIIGMSAIGQLKLEDAGRVRDCFHKIDVSSRYLLSLINDILDMSKIETGKMTIAHERFDFTELAAELNSIICPQAAERGVQFEVHHHEPLERYYIGDPLRLNQILMNLLSNALKFTPRGGLVVVDIREHKRANGFSMLRFSVRDNGVGMSKEFMQRIFQPFEQESPGGARNNVGSGLGLSIVYNLVQLMGGDIEVRSEKGRGSSFTVTLPFGLVKDDGDAELRRKSRELLRGLEVLVVDDDEVVGEQTSAILGEIGARTVWVDSGQRAVEEVRRSIEAGRVYDIAMIDWRMPGMDGVQTTRRLREMVGPDTMIIIISSYDWSVIEAEAREAGADCFIPKPLFRSVVYDTFMNLEVVHHEHRASARPGCRGRRVLLAEDNELNLEIAKSLLEMHGVVVETAENGKIAVERFDEAPPGYFLAILMDIRMPVMDGLRATREIRALGRDDAADVPILAMTANAFDEDKALAMEAGMNGYLVKPLDIGLLLHELEELAK